MNDVIISILSNFIYAFMIYIIVTIMKFAINVQPLKRLWGIKDIKDATIICATSFIETDRYKKPATGIGQVRALALTLASLNKAYKSVEVKNILLSDESIGTSTENNIISIGGPKNNRITKDILLKEKVFSIVEQVDNTIVWKKTGQIFEPINESLEIKEDLGLIIRMENPIAQNNDTIVVFSGSHTYGTIAAAKYFTENLYESAKKFKKLGRFYIAVVRCDVRDNSVTNLSLVEEHIEE